MCHLNYAKHGLCLFNEGNGLTRLEHLGITKSVMASKWAAPIVLILKADRKSIQICDDYIN